LPLDYSLFFFWEKLGQTLGVAIGGSIFQNYMKKRLAQYPTFESVAEIYSKDAAALVKTIKAMSQTPERRELVESYVYGLRVLYGN
jgi:hypothetical protein